MEINRLIVLTRFFPMIGGRQFLLSSIYLSTQYSIKKEMAAIGKAMGIIAPYVMVRR